MRIWTAIIAAAALAACSAEPEAPAAPEPPAIDIARLNSLQLAEIVSAFGPEGVKCDNANRYENFGAVPADVGEGPHAAHVGAYGYPVFCSHPEVEYDPKDPNQQWFIWVTGANPWQATVAQCFQDPEGYLRDNWCWRPYATTSEPAARPAPG